MATVSEVFGGIKIGPVEFSGLSPGWDWLALHLAHLIGFKTRSPLAVVDGDSPRIAAAS